MCLFYSSSLACVTKRRQAVGGRTGGLLLRTFVGGRNMCELGEEEEEEEEGAGWAQMVNPCRTRQRWDL